MVLLNCYQSEGINFQEWLTIALSVFAGLVSIGYFLRPRLYFIVYKKKNCNKKDEYVKLETLPIGGEAKADANAWKYCIKVENMNLFRNTIKEVKCEVAVSKDNEFKKMKTVKLKRKETLFLKSVRKFGGNRLFNYIFWFHENEIPDNYDFLRVRFLASNALGVKKHYERYYKLNEIEESDGENIKTYCQSWHKIKTNREFNFIKSGIRCCIGAKIEKLFGCNG